MPVYALPDNEWTHRGDTWPYMSTVISAAERHIVFKAMDRSNWILPVDEIWIDELI